jgi:hypothetical protein
MTEWLRASSNDDLDLSDDITDATQRHDDVARTTTFATVSRTLPRAEASARAALFFVFGCATSAAQTAILSMLTYYSLQFGPQTFVALNCATYLPSLPIVLVQSKLDSAYDRIYSTAVTFKFRIAVSFFVLAATLCALPLLPLREEWELLVCAAVIGIFTGVLFGSFCQLLTFVNSTNQSTNTAYFAFGYQGSGVVVLLLSLIAFRGHENAPTRAMLDAFFISVAVLPLVALVIFIALTATDGFRESASTRDADVEVNDLQTLPLLQAPDADRREQRAADQALLSSVGSEHVGSLGVEPPQEEEDGGRVERALSQTQILQPCFPCVACIFVTIFASIVVFPFYTFVPSNNPTFPLLLFYTKVRACVRARTARECVRASVHAI